MNWWKIAQTAFTVGAVGYAAYLWYDYWREEREEVGVPLLSSVRNVSIVAAFCAS